VDSESVYRWRSDLEKRWAALTDVARKRCYRKGGKVSMLAGCWELQERGAPHVHIALRYNTLGRMFAYYLKELAPQYGFGFVDTKLKPRHAGVVASYFAKYMTKYNQDEHLISELLPTRKYWVSRDLTVSTGATLRICKYVRKWWAYQSGYIPYSCVVGKWSRKEHEFVLKFFKGVDSEVGKSLDDVVLEGGLSFE
jgi:hypothetical protein